MSFASMAMAEAPRESGQQGAGGHAFTHQRRGASRATLSKVLLYQGSSLRGTLSRVMGLLIGGGVGPPHVSERSN